MFDCFVMSIFTGSFRTPKSTDGYFQHLTTIFSQPYLKEERDFLNESEEDFTHLRVTSYWSIPYFTNLSRAFLLDAKFCFTGKTTANLIIIKSYKS